MIERFSKTEELRTQLMRDGKVSFLDTPVHNEAIEKLNVELAEVRRDYKVKEKNSYASASNVVLTD
ncbi:MAG: hypothetical protein EOM90_07420 [Alphaproteobacteria bacterium]|nr:hypothetical protein [Alphaproteobacteria bacterium]